MLTGVDEVLGVDEVDETVDDVELARIPVRLSSRPPLVVLEAGADEGELELAGAAVELAAAEVVEAAAALEALEGVAAAVLEAPVEPAGWLADPVGSFGP